MAKICDNSKASELYKNKNEAFIKFNFKLQYPPAIPSEAHLEKAFKEKLSSGQSTNPQVPQKFYSFLKPETLRFKCHFEEKKRKAEMRRKKIIQKLKRVYRINVENLSENAANDIIRDIEVLEKEKKEKEKKAVENTVKMIARLLEEQKYKRRGIKNKVSQKRKKPKIIPSSELFSSSLCSNEWRKVAAEEYTPEEEEKLFDDLNQKGFYSKKFALKQTRISPSFFKKIVKAKEKRKMTQKKGVKYESEYVEDIFNKLEQKTDISKPCLWPRNIKPVPLEKNLQSDPKSVIFQDYKKGKTYFKNVRITNIGKETIHCRYLGILVHVKAEDRFPIGVAVRDNVKLKPGFSCSTKIKLCSQNDTNEQECSILYETRRQNKPLQHSCFFVSVKCIPEKAVIKVSPLKIRFPPLTWCSTKSPEGMKLLKKIIKIENLGGKSCSCKIIKNVREKEEKRLFENEKEWATRSSSTTSEVSKKNFFSSYQEYDGEENFFLQQDESHMFKDIINELFENVFSVFRFSKKYHIKLEPFSTVEIEIKFIPEYQGFHQELHVIQFQDCYSPVQEIIEITGDIKKIPLRAEPEVIDLKICTANSGVYAAKFKIYNTDKVPCSISLNIPKMMKKHAHLYPRSTIIQAKNHCDVSIKFYPRTSLLEDSSQYFDKDSGILEFPIFIRPSNLNSCKSDFIKIHVFALITDYALELSPPNIDFGTVSTLETFRTQILLTNHSLAAQKYGFLNLPKEMRVEPNMGFGWILPKESIPLYILYSPGTDLTKNIKNKINAYIFQIKVTSIAEYGGLREEEEFLSKKIKPLEDIWSQGDHYDDYSSETNKENYYPENEMSTAEEKELKIFEECKIYDTALEEEDSNEKLEKLEAKIRNFLRDDESKITEFLKKKNFVDHDENLVFDKNSKDITETKDIEMKTEQEKEEVEDEEEQEEEEEGEEKEFVENIYFKERKNIITCRARVFEPYCQISTNVIQLPATPCSSISLYKFKLNGFNESLDNNCTCGTHIAKSSKACNGKPKFEAAFEFQNSSPHITLEPQSGYLKAGESITINIIYKPKFSEEKIQKESQIQATTQEKSAEGKASFVNPFSKSEAKAQKISLPILKKSSDMKSSTGVTNLSIQNQNKYFSFFGGERNLKHMIDPFYIKVKINCIIKTIGRNDKIKSTESHDMILVCPCINPNFIYLGNSHEINFHKVFVGCKSKILIEAQNISLKRISPTVSLLNPTSSFSCAAFLKKLEVDPEHVWYYTLTYAPTEAKGVEKEFFEIQCESTNIFLMAQGEAIEPHYKITPAMACYILETKPGNYEEIKMEIENLSTINFPLQFVTEFVKEGYENEIEKAKESESGTITKEKSGISQSEKRKRKRSNSEKKKSNCWEEVPEAISFMLENFQKIGDDKSLNFFSLIGVDDNQKVEVPALGKSTVKIRYSPPFTEEKELNLTKKHAAKFRIMLEGSSKTIKEITIIGTISKLK